VQFKNVDDRKDYEGEVTENKATGKSIVFCQSLGHAREGMGSPIDMVHYRLIVYSKLAGDPGGG
jgi:hypothetical protein